MSSLVPVLTGTPEQQDALLPPMEFSPERFARELSGGRIERLNGEELWKVWDNGMTSEAGRLIMRWAELTARISQLGMARGYPLSNIGPAVFNACREYVDIGEGTAEKMAEATVLEMLRGCWKYGEMFHALYHQAPETPGDRELVRELLGDEQRRQRELPERS